jgi:hypothetical protein
MFHELMTVVVRRSSFVVRSVLLAGLVWLLPSPAAGQMT